MRPLNGVLRKVVILLLAGSLSACSTAPRPTEAQRATDADTAARVEGALTADPHLFARRTRRQQGAMRPFDASPSDRERDQQHIGEWSPVAHGLGSGVEAALTQQLAPLRDAAAVQVDAAVTMRQHDGLVDPLR